MLKKSGNKQKRHIPVIVKLLLITNNAFVVLEFKGFTLKNPDKGSALDPQAFKRLDLNLAFYLSGLRAILLKYYAYQTVAALIYNTLDCFFHFASCIIGHTV